jgi:hypothetical protein
MYTYRVRNSVLLQHGLRALDHASLPLLEQQHGLASMVQLLAVLAKAPALSASSASPTYTQLHAPMPSPTFQGAPTGRPTHGPAQPEVQDHSNSEHPAHHARAHLSSSNSSAPAHPLKVLPEQHTSWSSPHSSSPSGSTAAAAAAHPLLQVQLGPGVVVS